MRHVRQILSAGPFKRRLRAIAILLACFATLSWTSAVEAARGQSEPPPEALVVVSESVVVDAATEQVTFTMEFNRPPDFSTVDEYGRRADSFQYYILGDSSLPYPENYDAIIRGDELDLRRGVLPIRSATPADPDPVSGGWGAVRAEVPYVLDGTVLTFSASLGAISEHSPGGHFSYELLIVHYGSGTQFLQKDSVVIPVLPTAIHDCIDGGWHRFGFRNQGDCVSFVATRGKNLPNQRSSVGADARPGL
jgi:hypothetical protein